MACDICGKTGVTLERLQDSYQTEEVKDICSSCLKDLNDHLWKLRRVTSALNETWMKRFITNLREKIQRKAH